MAHTSSYSFVGVPVDIQPYEGWYHIGHRKTFEDTKKIKPFSKCGISKHRRTPLCIHNPITIPDRDFENELNTHYATCYSTGQYRYSINWIFFASINQVFRVYDYIRGEDSVTFILWGIDNKMYHINIPAGEHFGVSGFVAYVASNVTLDMDISLLG